MSIVNTLALESNRQIKINFDGGEFLRRNRRCVKMVIQTALPGYHTM